MILPTQGNPIDKSVRDAIDLRVKALKERAQGTSENLQAINYYFNSRTPWIKMTSSVDTAEHGSQLAADNILGTIQDTNDVKAPSGTELSKDFGIRPKAGITSMQVTSLGRFGALRDITISFTCFSREQLDKYEKLFMRPGASVLVEWGHSLYLAEDGTSIKVNQMGPGYQKMFDGNAKTIAGVYKDIKEIRKKYNYEYDAAFGLVKNFSWTFEGAGPTYECKIIVGSCGEVVGSVDSQKPLPDSLARKYKSLERYSDKQTPEVTELQVSGSQPTGSLQGITESVMGADYNPYDITTGLGTTVKYEDIQTDQTNIQAGQTIRQQEKKGEYVQERLEEVTNKFIPFLDGRNDWEVSSMLNTFLYEDLISTYHLAKIKEAQTELLKDTDLELFDRTAKPSQQSVPLVDSYLHVSTIGPNIKPGTWLVDKLGYQGELLTIFFREEEEESVEDLTEEDLDRLKEGEIASYERYRAMSYLRYSDLLSFINNMIFFNENGPLLTFDTSATGQMYYNEFVQSLDPRTCLLPSDVATFTSGVGLSFKKGSDYTRIGDIALNVVKLYEIAQNTRGSIKDFLEGVHTELARATGQILDLDVAYSEETAQYFIVDRRNYSKEPLPTVSLLGTDTIVRSFNLSTAISNEISSAVAISMGDARGTNRRNDISKTLFNFHEGIQDRNISTRDEYPPSISKENPKISGEYQETQTKVALVDITLRSLYENRLFSDELTDNLLNLFPKYIVEQAEEEDLGGVLLPYTLSTVVDGMSGFLVMDSFQIKTNILPSSYVKSTKVGNLIVGIDTTVNKSGWTTTLKSQYYNLPGTKPDLRIKKYVPPVYEPEIPTGIFNNISHNGVVVYSTDPNAPQNDLELLRQWVKDNFNANIQPQALGMLVELANGLIPPDAGTVDVEELYGYTIFITSTFRSLSKQQSLRSVYLEKRSKGIAGAIPAAAPGKSMHNWGGAIDFNIFNSRNKRNLFNGKTPQSEWNKLGINNLVSKFGFQYGIKNDPIHIEYNPSGTAVYNAYQTGKVVDRFGNPITDSEGRVIDRRVHPKPELAVDLTKFTSTPGLALPQYYPVNVQTDYIESIDLSPEVINPSDVTDLDLPELFGAEDVSGRQIDGLPESI